MKFSILDLLRQAIIAALYVLLVFVFQAFSFGEVQFRVAEVLLILIFFDKKSVIGLTLGVFVANLFSPMLAFDLSFGVFATVLSVFLMIITRKWPYIALIFPSVVNGIIIGLGLYFVLKVPIYVSIPSVFLGEFVVTYLVGLPLYYTLKRIRFESLYYTEKELK